MFLTTQNLRAAARTAALLLLSLPVAADQRGHHPGNPAPRSKMRPLAADRPDATESPQTVDAGHVQLEIDVAAYVRDRADAVVDAWAFGVANVKLGLTHNLDVQLVVPTWQRVKTPAGTVDGFGDLVLRAKVNLWGNDGDRPTAFALLPFVKFPTAEDGLGNDEVEGGIVFPFGTELPGGWGLGLQVGIDVVRNSADTDHDVDVSQTIVLGHDIHGPLAGFVELFSLFPGESGAGWVGTLNAGLTYAVDEDTQLDLATFVGLSREAEDVTVFFGVTRRF